MDIPKPVIDKLKEQAAGATFFGQPIETLTRDELIAAIGACRTQEKTYREMTARNEKMHAIFEAYRAKTHGMKP